MTVRPRGIVQMELEQLKQLVMASNEVAVDISSGHLQIDGGRIVLMPSGGLFIISFRHSLSGAHRPECSSFIDSLGEVQFSLCSPPCGAGGDNACLDV